MGFKIYEKTASEARGRDQCQDTDPILRVIPRVITQWLLQRMGNYCVMGKITKNIWGTDNGDGSTTP